MFGLFQFLRRNFRLFIVDHFVNLLVLLAWLSANLTLFIAEFTYYHRSPSFFYLRAFVSDGLSVSRASAACLNFNCALILLPVCRNLLSLIRCLLPRCLSRRWLHRPFNRLFDKHIAFHRCVGYAICFWSLLHVSGHIHNYERLIADHRLGRFSNVSVNPFKDMDVRTLSIRAMLGTTAGWTGVILCVCLLIIASSSVLMIRRSFYEIFWFAHHLFVVFFVCLMAHCSQGFLRAQVNLHEHDPLRCAARYRQWGIDPQCLTQPRFRGIRSTSWMWLCGPLSLYLLERLLRLIRSLQPVDIIDVIRHKSNVVELRFRKRAMATPQPGQYIYLKCVALATFEWHPFTVTSAAEEPFVSIHFRTVGNWTQALARKLEMYPHHVPRLSVDGPYGSPADGVFNYDTVILVGAGIGVTPYTAVLKHIRLSALERGKLRRIYFYWICNTIECYEWFGEMLQEVERDLRHQHVVLTLRIYLTQWSMDEVPDILRNNDDERDIYTGLKSKTMYGRPKFNADFQSIMKEKWKEKHRRCIGVFVCGPKPLVVQLRRLCMRLNDYNGAERRVHFHLNKENF